MPPTSRPRPVCRPNRKARRAAWALAALVVWCCGVNAGRAAVSDAKILVVVLDGFRSDYFTPELMPRAYAEAQRGVIGTAHHAVLPTVTRVNAATLVTGCLPARHGIVANSLYVPELNPTSGISTGDRKKLLRIRAAWGGRLLGAPTLADLMAKQGQVFLACSSGSSGSATLLNPSGAGAGILHPEFCVPESRAEHVRSTLGPAPKEAEPATALMQWMTDAYVKIGVPELNPRVTFLWFTEPDHTSHAQGVGAPTVIESIRFIDQQLGRLFDFHRERGMKVNVFIVADHGLVSHDGQFDVAATLAAHGWMERVHPVVIDGAIYLAKKYENHIPALVRTLQAEPTIGPIFTEARTRRNWKGFAQGTLSHALAGDAHRHAAQVVVFPNWTARTNAAGYPGTVQARGPAGHGGTSPWEINGVFAAFGPDIKAGLRSDVPTSNVDIAPTIAFLTGVPMTSSDGRVLKEILVNGPAPENIVVRPRQWLAQSSDASYSVTMKAKLVDGHRYVDEVSAHHQ